MTTIEPEGSVVLVRDEHDAEDTEPLFVEPGETSGEAVTHWLLAFICLLLGVNSINHDTRDTQCH